MLCLKWVIEDRYRIDYNSLKLMFAKKQAVNEKNMGVMGVNIFGKMKKMRFYLFVGKINRDTILLQSGGGEERTWEINWFGTSDMISG